MPRKNNPKPQRGGGPRRARADRFPIDWKTAEALHAGVDRDRTREPAFRNTDRPKKEKLHNEFTRKLTGFSDSALDVILRYGFENIDGTGSVAVTFTGISKRPTAEIGYERSGLVINRGGLVVVSGVIARQHLNEVGLGESGEIKRAGSEPVLDSHNSANRFNVALGRQPQGVREHELAGELLDGSTLVLSPVTEVNGHAIDPEASPWEIDEHWNRPPEPSPLGYTRWDQPPTMGGGYW
jgi:hypothetical protein